MDQIEPILCEHGSFKAEHIFEIWFSKTQISCIYSDEKALIKFMLIPWQGRISYSIEPLLYTILPFVSNFSEENKKHGKLEG